jgi:glyoxalase family protein
MALKLGFIGIVVSDMAASLNFYRMLGVPIPEGQDGEPHVDARLEDGTVLAWDTVGMIRSFDPDYVRPSGGHHIALAFDQGGTQAVDDAYTRFVSAGYTGKIGPWDAPWGQRYATVMDPDGNAVDLYAALGADCTENALSPSPRDGASSAAVRGREEVCGPDPS